MLFFRIICFSQCSPFPQIMPLFLRKRANYDFFWLVRLSLHAFDNPPPPPHKRQHCSWRGTGRHTRLYTGSQGVHIIYMRLQRTNETQREYDTSACVSADLDPRGFGSLIQKRYRIWMTLSADLDPPRIWIPPFTLYTIASRTMTSNVGSQIRGHLSADLALPRIWIKIPKES